MSNNKPTKEYVELRKLQKTYGNLFDKVRFNNGLDNWDELPTLIFNKADVNKPKLIYLGNIIGEIAVVVFNNQIFKWHLQSKQLKEYIPFLEHVCFTRIKRGVRKMLKVTYKGTVGPHHIRFFNIEGTIKSGKKIVWIDLKKDVSYIVANPTSFSVERPYCMGGGTVINLQDLEDCIMIRDLMLKHGFPKGCRIDKRSSKSKVILKNVEQLMKKGQVTINQFKQCYNVEETQQKSSIKIPTDQIKLLEEKEVDIAKIIDEVCQKLRED